MIFRQLVVGSPECFFCVARCILQMYKLSTVSSLESFTKMRWKNISRQAVSQYWTEKLREEAADKSSLTNCNLTEMTSIGKSHQIWNNVGNNTTDIKRNHQGQDVDWCYMLQTTKSRFNQYEVEQICPLCRLAAEDLQHMLLRCPALSEVRSHLFSSIRQLLISHLGSSWWLTRSGTQIVRLCVDSTNLMSQTQSAIEECFLERLEMLGRRFCHKLHIKNFQLHQKL